MRRQRYSQRIVSQGDIRQRIREGVEKLLGEIRRQDRYELFEEPVNMDEVPDYLTIISTPMDFQTMEKKLLSGEYEERFHCFKIDFAMICNNALNYNEADTLYWKEAERLEKAGGYLIDEFEREILIPLERREILNTQIRNTQRKQYNKPEPDAECDSEVETGDELASTQSPNVEDCEDRIETTQAESVPETNECSEEESAAPTQRYAYATEIQDFGDEDIDCKIVPDSQSTAVPASPMDDSYMTSMDIELFAQQETVASPSKSKATETPVETKVMSSFTRQRANCDTQAEISSPTFDLGAGWGGETQTLDSVEEDPKRPEDESVSFPEAASLSTLDVEQMKDGPTSLVFDSSFQGKDPDDSSRTPSPTKQNDDCGSHSKRKSELKESVDCKRQREVSSDEESEMSDVVQCSVPDPYRLLLPAHPIDPPKPISTRLSLGNNTRQVAYVKRNSKSLGAEDKYHRQTTLEDAFRL